MRVLMFGRGVIATMYGWALQEAGHHVEFYVRPGRSAEHGGEVRMDVIDARRRRLGERIDTSFRTSLRESFDAGDDFDLIVLSVAHHRLAEASAFLAPRIGNATVLVFGNVWEEPLAAVSPLPAEQLVFGFPGAGGGFGDDGALHGAMLRSVIIGRGAESPTRRERKVTGAFRSAGLRVREEKDMRGWLWIHFISDAGMFAQGVRSGSLAAMTGDRRAFRQAFLGARELLPILQARGVDIRRHRTVLLPLRLPGLVSAVAAWATARFPVAQESLAAHTDPHAPEPRAVLADALRETRRLGIPAPRIESSSIGE